MKIIPDLRTQLDSSKKNHSQAAKSNVSFEGMVEAHGAKRKELELQHLMKSLTLQGERVARKKSFQDLAKYKRLVKQFVEEAVQFGMELKHSHSWNRSGNNRRLTIVEEVDSKLVQLTEAVMDQEKKSIDILGIIGEIKGLLVNLYT